MSSVSIATGKRIVETASERKRVVILGCGWGAYQFLKGIDQTKYKCFVVSPRNHMLFTPLLASSAVGTTTLRSICQPVRPLVAEKMGRYYEAKAVGVEKDRKVITCAASAGEEFELAYDKLVIGVGFQANDFGIPEVGKYAKFMKETADAEHLHEHILARFERASLIHVLDGDEYLSQEEEDQIKKLLSFVIVGAGPTGTELAGELCDLVRKDIFSLYSHLKKYITVHLVDGAPVVLAPFQDPTIQAYAKRWLEKKQSVQVHLNEMVAGITEDSISFKSGTKIDYGTLIWCAGIKPYPFIANLDVSKNERGSQLLTDTFLKVKGEKDIYALGDCGTIENYWLPQTAQVATQQAKYLAKEFNQGGSTGDGQGKSFKFYNMGMMASLGNHNAVMKFPFPIFSRVTGILGYISWRSAYWSMQLSMRNRLLLLFDWIQCAMFGRDLMRKGTISTMKVEQKQP